MTWVCDLKPVSLCKLFRKGCYTVSGRAALKESAEYSESTPETTFP